MAVPTDPAATCTAAIGFVIGIRLAAGKAKLTGARLIGTPAIAVLDCSASCSWIVLGEGPVARPILVVGGGGLMFTNDGRRSWIVAVPGAEGMDFGRTNRIGLGPVPVESVTPVERSVGNGMLAWFLWLMSCEGGKEIDPLRDVAGVLGKASILDETLGVVNVSPFQTVRVGLCIVLAVLGEAPGKFMAMTGEDAGLIAPEWSACPDVEGKKPGRPLVPAEMGRGVASAVRDG